MIELTLARDFPYDEQSDGGWTYLAARAVIANLSDRRGIGPQLDAVDLDVRREIIERVAEIISATSPPSKRLPS